MRDMRDSQDSLGGFPGVAPPAQYGNEQMRFGWADAGIIVPWTVWKQFGDRQIVEENWNAMDLFMNHVNDTKYDHETLCAENGNFQFADWLSYEPLESWAEQVFSAQGLLPDAIGYWNYLSACYWMSDALMMADMAAATGRDAAKYRQMADAARTYIKERFLAEDGTFKIAILNTMQTPALFALKNGLVEGEAKQGCAPACATTSRNTDSACRPDSWAHPSSWPPSRRTAWRTLPTGFSSSTRTPAGSTPWTTEPPPSGNGGTATRWSREWARAA